MKTILKVTKLATGSTAKDLPEPSSMSISVMDIDAGTTQRNAAGTMVRNRVCGGAKAKRKIECKWAGLKLADASYLLKLIEDTFFKVTYYDPYTADVRTATFYVGDRTCQVFRVFKDKSGEVQEVVMESISANFIEK